MLSQAEDEMRVELASLTEELRAAAAEIEAHQNGMFLRAAALLANEELPPFQIVPLTDLQDRLAKAESNHWAKSGDLLLLVQRKDSELKALHAEMQEQIVALMNNPVMYQKFETELKIRRK